MNTFESIRWPDPFPEDNETFEFNYKNFSNINSAPSDTNDNVYPSKRMLKNICPSMIYVPSKEMMFKMMRACEGVTDTNNLWIDPLYSVLLDKKIETLE